ncbi:MAG TPA: hypothetical protein IGR89_07260 [Oscillatoriaceae cyanobacterium M7585_C2015_266]|nr:hypothetical protein [Oscillatoriaceae cyanobacterium M7585_C2015_266]
MQKHTSFNDSPGCFFASRVGVLATKHQKERVIAPIMERELNVRIIVPADFDTDVFGTFTREVKRTGTQIEAARLKAKKALEITGETLAIASEGTFGPHPVFPYIPHNLEIVLLLDTENNIEIIGEEFSTETNYSHELVKSVEEGFNFAKKVGFPEHGIVVIIGEPEEGKGEIIKGIVREEKLFEVLEYALKKSPDGRVHIETDMRAMYNPTRMKNIEKATLDLIKKINQICPQCGCPGFDVVERKKGLPCALCHLPTQLTRSLVYKCKKCGFSKEELFPDGREYAEPAQCHYCNP